MKRMKKAKNYEEDQGTYRVESTTDKNYPNTEMQRNETKMNDDKRDCAQTEDE